MGATRSNLRTDASAVSSQPYLRNLSLGSCAAFLIEQTTEYAVAKGNFQMKISDEMSDEQASTLGVGITTVGQALYQSLGLPLPGAESAGVPLLIYGGSTATGSLAIQFAVR